MITVYIRKRIKPYGYQTVNTVTVATQAEADEIIASWENHPYAYATTVPQRKQYRKRYRTTGVGYTIGR